jgi:hypothetical protein
LGAISQILSGRQRYISIQLDYWKLLSITIRKDNFENAQTERVKHEIRAVSNPQAQAFRSATRNANFCEGEEGDLLNDGEDGDGFEWLGAIRQQDGD